MNTTPNHPGEDFEAWSDANGLHNCLSGGEATRDAFRAWAADTRERYLRQEFGLEKYAEGFNEADRTGPFFVSVSGERAPVVVHKTLQEAIKEAERLSTKCNPHMTITIMKGIMSYKPVVKREWGKV